MWAVAVKHFRVACKGCGYIYRISLKTYIIAWLLSCLTGFISFFLIYAVVKVTGGFDSGAKPIELLVALTTLSIISFIVVRVYVFVIYKHIKNSYVK